MPVTMIELADEIIRLTNSSSKLVFKNLPQDDPRTREPNIEKAVQILNWEPRISREKGLLETIKYFEGQVLN